MTPALEQIKALRGAVIALKQHLLLVDQSPQALAVAADADTALQALRDEAGEAVQQLAECFRLAGGDTECVSTPEGQAKQAAEVVRDLRACYDEAIRPAPAAPVSDEAGEAWRTVHVLTSVMRLRPLTDAEQDELHWAHIAVRENRPAPAAEARDPHHGGSCKWRWENGRLYHLGPGASKWVEVKRVSVTADRIRTIAALLPAAEAAPQGGVDALRALATVQRYAFPVIHIKDGPDHVTRGCERSNSGRWVQFCDVEAALLAASPPSAPAVEGWQRAWEAVAGTLTEVAPGWNTPDGTSDMQRACNTIRRLAATPTAARKGDGRG